MAKNSSNQGSVLKKSKKKPVKSFKRREELKSNHYFDNEVVEDLLYRYLESACTDVTLRDEIMEHATELIRQIIKAHNLGQIYPGKDEASIGDLSQVAWLQIESVLYKYEARPHCSHCYNPLRPNDSLLSDDFIFRDEVTKIIGRCPHCHEKLMRESVYYRGKSKLFNMWCVSPKTQVITQCGIREIGDILDTKNLLYGINGLHEIVSYIKKKEQDTRIVRTIYDYNIEITPEHYLYKLTDNGPEWTQSKDFKEGDFLGIQCGQQLFSNNNDISDIKVSGWNVPDKITPELAYIFGLYIAEGCYKNNVFHIYNTDLDVMETLQQNSFGLRFSYNSNNTSNYTNSKGFNEFMDALGFDGSIGAQNKYIPPRLMAMSKENINALLMGLFDGDGHSSRHNGSVGFTSCSIKLIEQVRMLLLNIGLLSKLSRDLRKTRAFVNRYNRRYNGELKGAYQLNLSTVDSLRFYDRVGFGIKRKQCKMDKLPIPKDMIYCVGDKFRNLYRKYGAMGYYNTIRRVVDGCDNITIKKAVAMLQYWKKHEDDQDYRFISSRLDEYYRFKDRVVWLPIAKIEESRSEVCDVEISSDDHSYIANGFISHNSQISRTVILAYIKKENRDKKNNPVFQEHLENKTIQKSFVLDRFFNESREIFKYNMDYIKILNTIEQIYLDDDRPHEGLIGKIVEKSGLQRQAITTFLRVVRLRGHDFSDSPMNEENDTMRKLMTSEADDQE